MQFNIFIVEDDPWYGAILKHHLELNPDYTLELFNTGKDLLNSLYKKPDLVCMDFGLPDIKGDKLLKEINARNRNLPVVVISAQDEISIAVELLKAGAKDYIIKDDHTKEQLWKSIIHIRENLSLKQEVEELKEQLGQKYSFENSIIGQSDAIKRTFNLLQKAIQSNINVSLTGATGTGKEVYAKAIHFNSDRKRKTFMAVNMGAIPSELVESELFGHEKGAFTGANNTKIGKFEEAEGGTLFLDEISELDLSLQSKLLRAIQEREIVRVGGNDATEVNLKIEGEDWRLMQKVAEPDPFYSRQIKLQEQGDASAEKLPYYHERFPISQHLWKMTIPRELDPGVYKLEVRAKNNNGLDATSHSLLFVQ